MPKVLQRKLESSGNPHTRKVVPVTNSAHRHQGAPRALPRPISPARPQASVQRHINPHTATTKIAGPVLNIAPAPRSSNGRFTSHTIQKAEFIRRFLGQKSDETTSLSSSSSSSPVTPTEAYVRARRNSVEDVHREVKPVEKSELYNKAVAQERLHTTDKIVFYNSAGIKAYAFHQLVKCIWNETNWRGKKAKNFEFLRSPGTEITAEAKNDPQTYLDKHYKRGWSDHSDRVSLLSTNLTLFGNVRTGGTESTYSMSQSQNIQDINVQTAVSLLTTQMELAELPEELIKEVLNIAEGLLKTLERSASQTGAIYQIFVPNDKVCDLAYVSSLNGVPLHIQGVFTMIEPETMSKALGQDQFCLNAKQFTNASLSCVKDPQFWANFKGGYDPQARLLMNPKFFSQPNKIIHINTFTTLTKENQRTVNDALESITVICGKWQRIVAQRIAALLEEHHSEIERCCSDMLPLQVMLSGSVGLLYQRYISIMEIVTEIQRRKSHTSTVSLI
jgi:hypothetical protein